MALRSAGSTTHYAINYDDSLSQVNGPDRAGQLLAVCEQVSMAARFPASEAAQNQATAGDRSEGL
jgi:hypothetical protein